MSRPDLGDGSLGGETLGPRVSEPLTVSDFLAYQDVCDNRHPIHYDSEYALALGFPAPVAPGMLTAGILANYVAEVFGVSNVRRFQAQFRDRAFVGDVLTYRASIASTSVRDGERWAEVDLSVTRQTGATHIKGSATVVISFSGRATLTTEEEDLPI